MSNPKIKFIVTPPPDATVENSDASYTNTVASGSTLVVPDINIEVNTVVEGAIPALKDVKILITDGVNPVTPDDVSVVGDTVTVEVPSGGGAFDVDLVDRFGNAFPTKQVAANATWDLRTLTPFDFADLFLTLNSTTFTSGEEAAIITFFEDMVIAGCFQGATKIDLNLGGNAADHAINARYPFNTKSSQFSRYLGSPTHNANGVILNGSNVILTCVSPTQVNSDLRQVSIYNRIDVVAGGIKDIITTVGLSPEWKLRYTTQERIGFDDVNANSVNTAFPYKGLVSLGRSSAAAATNSIICRVNGAYASNKNTAFVNDPLGEVVIGGQLGTNYAITNGTPMEIAYIRIGDYLDDTQETDHYNIVQSLQTAFSRQV